MTLSKFNRLVNYWKKAPPSHLILAAANGIKIGEDKPWEDGSPEALMAAWAGVEGGGAKIG